MGDPGVPTCSNRRHNMRRVRGKIGLIWVIQARPHLLQQAAEHAAIHDRVVHHQDARLVIVFDRAFRRVVVVVARVAVVGRMLHGHLRLIGGGWGLDRD